MKTLPYKKVNAFTAGASKGNPAAYLMTQQPLTAREMLSIGRGHKGFVSEVVFCEPSACADVKLTYYSSECEVDFCGHGTVATMYDLISTREDLLRKPEVRVETNRKGVLTVYNRVKEEGAVYITAPKAVDLPCKPDRTRMAQALGISPDAIRADLQPDVIDAGLRTLIVPIADLDTEIRTWPDLGTLKTFCEDNEIDILLLFSMQVSDPAFKAHTRVFAPRFGYLEDPATGSGNSAFANYLLKNGLWDGAPIAVEQGGEDVVYNRVNLALRGGEVLFGGSAVTVISGNYYLND